MNKTFIQREGERVKNTNDLYKKYIHMICKQESAVVYRMNTPMGEGIMHWYSIADGIDYVYSEIETYYPRYQEQKEIYGVTIHDYRKHVRMQEAKNLLLKEDMSITEIAGACGYANASKFSSAFKDTVGILPGKWRKKSIQNTL